MAVLGFLASVAVMVAAGRSLVPVGMVLPTAFGGLLSPAHSGGGICAAVVISGAGVLVSCWWFVLAQASAGRLSLRGISVIAGSWAAPVLVGPPLLSFDAYAYMAQGELAARGMDPYAVGPVALGADPIVAWVDPTWRSSPAPYGPVAIVVLRAVTVLAGDLTSRALTLRLVAVVGVAAAAGTALLLSPPRRRPFVLALTLANPVTLMHLVGGAHLDALLAGLISVALLALHAGRSRSSLLFAGLAVACKVTVLPLFLLLSVVLVRRRGRSIAWFAPVALLFPFFVTGLVLDRPWGFLGALTVPGTAPPWYAPSSLIGLFLRQAASSTGLTVDPRLAAHIGAGLALAAGSVVVLSVLRAAWVDRGATTHTTIARAGVVLTAVALSLPALYSWYLGPALFVVAATGSDRLRHVMVVLCSLLSFSSLPVLYDAPRWLIAAAWAVTLGLLAGRALRHRPERAPTVSPDGLRPVEEFPRAGSHGLGWMPRLRWETEPRAVHRKLPAAIRLAELVVLPALLLAVAVPQARAVDSPARHAALDADVQAAARVTTAVQKVYPDHQIARVLPATGAPANGGRDFAVELVLPGKRSCWVQLRLPAVGPPDWVDDDPQAASRPVGRCSERGLREEAPGGGPIPTGRGPKME